MSHPAHSTASDSTASRGTVTIAVEACKGCDMCVPVCPPQVLYMSEDRNTQGFHYPVLEPGCTGCGRCLDVCPDFVFEVFTFPGDAT